MNDYFEMETMRKLIVILDKIHDEMKKQNELKELELEMRKFWIDRKVSEWKQEYRML